jgi:putative toxin-antitoxin system antitoxin component (TIGR02293 family)
MPGREAFKSCSITINDIADILGISHPTLICKEQPQSMLSPVEADRAYRLARIADLAVELIGDRKRAFTWMRNANAYLGGETPVRMLDTEIGTDLVIESLHSIAYGGVA